MKPLSIILVIIILSACSMQNKMVVLNDPFRETKNFAMFQYIWGTSDRPEFRWHSLNRYNAKVTWYQIKKGNSTGVLLMTFGIETDIQKELLEPELYLLVKDKKVKLQPEKIRYENFNQSNSGTNKTTDEITVTETDVNVEDSTKKVTTNIETHNSISPQRFAQLKFMIPQDLNEELLEANQLAMRCYLGDEGMTFNFRNKQMNAIKRFLKKLQEM
jgi:hypothetical protein